MKNLTRRLVKKILYDMGFEIVRASKSPKYNLIGTRNFNICSVIDIGANVGQFAKMILGVFPEAHVYSFEPLPVAFSELSKFAESQNGKITEGTVEMFHPLDFSPSSSLLRTTDTCTTLYPFTERQATTLVELTTLDKVVASLCEPLIPDILVKLDVQGYENRVIKGGIETFHKARVCIVEVSLDTLYQGQTTFREIFFLLDTLGYRYAGSLEQSYAKDGHVVSIDAVFLR